MNVYTHSFPVQPLLRVEETATRTSGAALCRAMGRAFLTHDTLSQRQQGNSLTVRSGWKQNILLLQFSRCQEPPDRRATEQNKENGGTRAECSVYV